MLAALLGAVGLREARASAPQVLSEYVPAKATSPYGPVSLVRLTTGTVELDPKILVYAPAGTMRDVSFSENVWVIGYQTSIHDDQGRVPRENFICHTLFGDQRVVQRQDQRMRALYSDGLTRGFRLPDGFAVPFSARDRIHFMPMFNNRTNQKQRVRMDVEVMLIREKDLRKPLQTLYSTLRSVTMPHLYFVPPQRHEQKIEFALPFSGRIHFMGTHVHPYAESMEVYHVSQGHSLWRGTPGAQTDGSRNTMQTYSNVEGYPVHAGDVFRVTSVYNNPTTDKIDAMAAVFFYYSEEQGRTPGATAASARSPQEPRSRESGARSQNLHRGQPENP